MKKSRCVNWKLYLITEQKLLGNKALLEAVTQAIAGGADVIQLRDKSASDEMLKMAAQELLRFMRPKGIPLVINDRIQVAHDAGADGVHLGQDDASYREARSLLGSDAIIGCSTHSSEQALKAQAEGFDYIGVGPVFSTPTKPTYEPVGLELVRFAAKNIEIPFVAIGGIDQTNITQVRQAGAKTVAVVRAAFGASDIRLAAAGLKEKMKG